MADLDEVLRAVAAGQVVRSGTGYGAPHLLAGENVSMEIRVLAHHELVEAHMSGPPALAPLGEELLAEIPAGQRFQLANLPARYRQGRANPRRKQRYH